MSIPATKPKNKVFLLLGIVLAALAFGGVLFALRQNGASAPTQSVVVAKHSISAGTTITADLITVVDEPQTAVPSDAFAVPSAVVNKTPTVTIGANDPIVPAFFAAQPIAAQTTGPNGTTTPVSLETSLTKGYVALAIPAAGIGTGTTPDLASAGLYIVPGDHIDILIDPGVPNNPGIRYSFQDVPVLRVGSAGASAAPTVFVVEVSRDQAEALTALMTGKVPQTFVKYVLRPQSEWGKLAPDNSSYTPNYESATTGPALTPGQDSTANAASLNKLFGG